MKRGKRLRRISIWLCAGFVALVSALVVAWATGLILHNTSEAASVKQALHNFRAGNFRKSGLNGVYVYATHGHESIDALGGAHHTYPATTSITVIEVPCGLQLRWAGLEGRSTTWTFCRTTLGTELFRSDERHGFFGQHDHTVYTCSHRILLPVNAKVGAVFPFNCTSKHASENGEMRVLGREKIDLGGRRISALRVRSTLTVHGGSAGHETVNWWLDSANALPLRVVMKSRTSRALFLGRVHYREDFTLRLLSLTPKR